MKATKNRYIAFKIAVAYFILGFLWILFSDHLVTLMTSEPELLTEIQTYKGWFYIAITAVLLYWLIRNELKKKNKINEELEQAKRKAEESDRLKTAFLSNMSHEIRTPLNGILGFSSMLSDGNYRNEKERKLFMDQINNNSENLMKIINDIIDISKIQENQVDINPKKFDLNELMDQLYNQYLLTNDKIKEKKVSLKMVKPENPACTIFSDPHRVQQVTINLLNNAIKYTPSGEITLGYIEHPEGVEIFVQDNGVGISEEGIKKLFERFSQSDPTMKSDGFGLGLAISKGLVEALGGQIHVKSKPGKGSRFSFKLPETLQITLNQ